MSWLSVEMKLLDLARGTVGLAINWVLQSTLLIVIGLVLARLLSKQGSATQSVVYRTTLAAVLICPLLTWTISLAGVSGWSLNMPLAWSLQPDAQSRNLPENRIAGGVESDNSPRSKLESPLTGVLSTTQWPNVEPFDPAADSNMSRTQISDTNLITTSALNIPHDSGRFGSVTVSPISEISIPTFGLLAAVGSFLWLSISIWLLAQLAVAWWRLAGIRQSAVPAEITTIRDCRELSALMGVAPPAVLYTPFLPSPCLAGLLRPAVLLPEAELSVSLREVLIHELAHLCRRDVHWNLLRKLATRVFWFQPLLWILSRRIEITAEEVCDDFVVELGGDRVEYANRLVDVAEFSSVPMAPAAVAMVLLQSLLIQRITRIMDTSRRLSTRTSRWLLNAALAGGCLGTLIIGFLGAAPPAAAPAKAPSQELALAAYPQPNDAAKPSQSTATEASKSATAAAAASVADGQIRPAKESIGGKFTVRGRVQKPDGQPALGAKVSVRRNYYTARASWSPMASTVTGTDGGFEISYNESTMLDGEGSGPDSVAIVAETDGFGVQWRSWTEIDASSPLVLKLVPDYPIHGRVTDLEGKPIAGVKVRVINIQCPKPGEDLGPWIESVKTGAIRNVTSQKLGGMLPPTIDGHQPVIATDRDGRFTLVGIGAERLAHLELRGDSIAYRQVCVATRVMPTLKRNLWFHSGIDKPPTKDQVFGADFTCAALPTRIVEGTIRDATSGKPLAGIEIRSDHLAGMQIFPYDVLRTQTDAQGHYRLVGMPKGDGPNLADLNLFHVIPHGEVPYLMREISVPVSPGISPVKLDLELHRGIWITGQVTDKDTGKPVRARLQYLPFLDNPHTLKRPEFTRDGNMNAARDNLVTDQDGKYRIPGLPGRGIIVVSALNGGYLNGLGADDIPGRNPTGDFPTYRGSIPADPRFCNAMKEIKADGAAETATCDFALDPGKKLQVTVVDLEGKPVDGCEVLSRTPHGNESSMPAVFDVINLAPNETRNLMVVHQKRNIGKIFKVTLKAGEPQKVKVVLEPCGAVKGRLVDPEGVPFKGLEISANPSREVQFTSGPRMIPSNSDGTFEYSHLPKGCESYSLWTMGTRVGFATISEKVVIEPGKTIDLRDVTLKPQE